jgi:hypothetical protein
MLNKMGGKVALVKVASSPPGMHSTHPHTNGRKLVWPALCFFVRQLTCVHDMYAHIDKMRALYILSRLDMLVTASGRLCAC